MLVSSKAEGQVSGASVFDQKHTYAGEMERALQNQAHLIGHYATEEKAQREWEETHMENDSNLLAPNIELKPLHDHLKYVFLGHGETLSVIINNKLNQDQEEKLVEVMKEHKTAIWWTIVDIKGINPSVCMHLIPLEENAKPPRQHQ